MYGAVSVEHRHGFSISVGRLTGYGPEDSGSIPDGSGFHSVSCQNEHRVFPGGKKTVET